VCVEDESSVEAKRSLNYWIDCVIMNRALLSERGISEAIIYARGR